LQREWWNKIVKLRRGERRGLSAKMLEVVVREVKVEEEVEEGFLRRVVGKGEE